jgi:uncharacterized protein involved in exopolysaccharide biosynthesis
MTLGSVGPGNPAPLGGTGLTLVVLRHRRIIARAVMATVSLTFLACVLMPRTWTSRGSFVAETGGVESLGALAGLASQFDLRLGGSSGSYPPRFFSALVTSDEVLGAVVVQPAPTEVGGGPPTSVAEALGARGATPGIKRARGIERARRDVVSALYDQRTGVTSFSVRTRSAALSAQIAEELVKEVNRFNAERHQSQASAERAFVEQRRIAIEQELHEAEDAVRTFLVRNRPYASSPELRLEFDRLSRRVGALSTVFTSLTQSFEKARIEEVRDTPVLTIVDSPSVPALPDSRSVVEWVVSAGLLTLLVMIGGLVAMRLLGLIPPPHEGEPQDFGGHWPALRAELLHPWRLIA